MFAASKPAAVHDGPTLLLFMLMRSGTVHIDSGVDVGGGRVGLGVGPGAVGVGAGVGVAPGLVGLGVAMGGRVGPGGDRGPGGAVRPGPPPGVSGSVGVGPCSVAFGPTDGPIVEGGSLPSAT